MNVKKLMIRHQTKGNVPLGSLSKNELCRGIADLMREHSKIQYTMNIVLGNMQASADAST